MNYLDFSPDNPFRALSWRWRRAEAIASGVLPQSRRRDNDHWVDRAARYLFQHKTCQSGLDLSFLAEEAPDIYWAFDLFKAEKGLHPCAGLRYEIEARLLAGVSNADIGECTSVRQDTIEAFEQLFFNVRPKLDNESYILQCVLGAAIQRGISTREYDLLWKLYGYLRGPHTLDFAIRGWTTGRRVVNKGDVARQMEMDLADEVLQQAGFTVKALRSNSENQADVVGLYYKLRDMEQAAGSATGAAKDAITEAVQVFVQTSNYLAGPPARRDTEIMDLYDRTDYELTTEEILTLSDGGTLDLPYTELPANPDGGAS